MARRPTSTSATTSASPTPAPASTTTSPRAKSTTQCCARSAGVSTSARPCRSFRTSPTRSSPLFSRAPVWMPPMRPMWPSWRLAARWATSSRCPSSRPFVSSVFGRAATAVASCTSLWCPTFRRPVNSRPSPPSTRFRSCARSASARTCSFVAQTVPFPTMSATRSRSSPMCPPRP